MSIRTLHEGAEWYNVPTAKRSALQRLAFRTRGLITLANIATCLGGLLTIIGLVLFCARHFTIGATLIIVGRLCDILDGWLARKTHTSSPFGEGLDAGVDKLVVLLTAIVLLWMHIVPWPLIVLAAMLQAGTALLVLGARHLHILLHPSRVGKYSMFGTWVAVSLYLFSYMLAQQGHYVSGVFIAAQVGMVVSLAGYAEACIRYIRQIRRQLGKTKR